MVHQYILPLWGARKGSWAVHMLWREAELETAAQWGISWCKWPVLQAKSGSMSRCSMVLWQPGSVLMFLVHITTKSHADAYGLCCHLKLCWCPRALLCPYWFSTWPQQENWSHPSPAITRWCPQWHGPGRAGPDGMDFGELTLVAWVWEKRPNHNHRISMTGATAG